MALREAVRAAEEAAVRSVPLQVGHQAAGMAEMQGLSLTAPVVGEEVHLAAAVAKQAKGKAPEAGEEEAEKQRACPT